MALRHKTSSYYKIQFRHVKPYQEEKKNKSKYWGVFTDSTFLKWDILIFSS